MILREVRPDDIQFIYECYQDWPAHPRKGIVTLDKVDSWVRRWINRDDEVALIGETLNLVPRQDLRTGLITYRPGPYKSHDHEVHHLCVHVDNIVVHPALRSRGYSKNIIDQFSQRVFKQGYLAAYFETLPGPIRDKYGETAVITPMNFKL